ncbi:MAG: hypothetical protein JNK94_02740 [Hyphomonadaceae bacterium]|nr:hypothetical protein [Hyphomonadaceae bacterium]
MSSGFKDTLGILGSIAAAPSIISLLQHMFALDLSPFAADFVEFYRDLMRPIFETAYWPVHRIAQSLNLNFVVPEWMGWMHALAFAGMSIFYRALDVDGRFDLHPMGRLLLCIGFSLAAALTLMGLVVLLFAVLPWMFMWRGKTDDERRVGVYGWAAVLGVLAFYGLNGAVLATQGGV